MCPKSSKLINFWRSYILLAEGGLYFLSHTSSLELGARVSRKASIMADAAYAILAKESSGYTGNLAYDEDVLKEEGVEDSGQYDVDPSRYL